MPPGIGAAAGIKNVGGKSLGTAPSNRDSQGGQGGNNSRSNTLGKQGGGNRPNRKTMLTADTTSYDEAEIDPETGEVTRFDPNPKKRKRTVLDVEGTPTLDELRAATKALLGY